MKRARDCAPDSVEKLQATKRCLILDNDDSDDDEEPMHLLRRRWKKRGYELRGYYVITLSATAAIINNDDLRQEIKALKWKYLIWKRGIAEPRLVTNTQSSIWK